MSEVKVKFTAKQIGNYKKYERVRISGRWNMYDPKARAATGMNKDEYTFVMKNFQALRDAANAEGEVK